MSRGCIRTSRGTPDGYVVTRDSMLNLFTQCRHDTDNKCKQTERFSTLNLTLHHSVPANVRNDPKMTSKSLDLFADHFRPSDSYAFHLSTRRSLEVATFIRQTFEPVILTSQFPRSQIDIYVQVFQHDGGILQCAINAATMALIDAGIPMTDYVCACSAGCIDRVPVLGKITVIV